MKKILAHDLSNHEFKIDHLCSTDVADFEQEGKQDGDILVWNSVEKRWNLYHGLFTRLKAATLLWCDTFDANGMQLINYGGAEREMHVEFFNGKAYAEIFVSKANNVNEPWDNWINATTNKIESYNLAPHNGLNYETAESSVCIAPEVLTSLLITAKTSYTGGINPDAIATTNHLSSANRAQFLDYFTGQIPGFEQLGIRLAVVGPVRRQSGHRRRVIRGWWDRGRRPARHRATCRARVPRSQLHPCVCRTRRWVWWLPPDPVRALE